MASVIQGHRNPFGKALLEYNTAQLDFVLEMAAIDEPDRWKFRRSGEEVERSESLARWRDSLAGRALVGFLARTGLAHASRGLAAYEARRLRGTDAGMKPGLSRAGKALPDARSKG